jgi:hypothetical protein
MDAGLARAMTGRRVGEVEERLSDDPHAPKGTD